MDGTDWNCDCEAVRRNSYFLNAGDTTQPSGKRHEICVQGKEILFIEYRIDHHITFKIITIPLSTNITLKNTSYGQTYITFFFS